MIRAIFRTPPVQHSAIQAARIFTHPISSTTRKLQPFATSSFVRKANSSSGENLCPGSRRSLFRFPLQSDVTRVYRETSVFEETGTIGSITRDECSVRSGKLDSPEPLVAVRDAGKSESAQRFIPSCSEEPSSSFR